MRNQLIGAALSAGVAMAAPGFVEAAPHSESAAIAYVPNELALSTHVGIEVATMLGAHNTTTPEATVAHPAVCTYVVPPNSGEYRLKLTTGLTAGQESKYSGIPVDKLFTLTTLPYPCKTGENPTASTTPETATTTTVVSPAATTTTINCAFNAITAREAANLLGASNKTGKELCALVLDFQRTNKLAVDGTVSPANAKKMILKSPNACAVYGKQISNCFFGLQENGNLGTLFIIEDGKIVDSIPSRFGNPALHNGEKTPEGTFKINRAISGDHAGTNCLKGADGMPTNCMRNPVYFAGTNGGIAIHGTNNPQAVAGSHGCIGINNAKSKYVYDLYKAGKIHDVTVLDTQRP